MQCRGERERGEEMRNKGKRGEEKGRVKGGERGTQSERAVVLIDPSKFSNSCEFELPPDCRQHFLNFSAFY